MPPINPDKNPANIQIFRKYLGLENKSDTRHEFRAAIELKK